MKQRNIVGFVLSVYSIVLAALTLGKSQLVIGHLWKKSAHRVRKLELIPFGDFFHTHPWWGPITNFIANVGLFVPFGMLLTMWWGNRPGTTKKVVIASLMVSLFIEISQYIFRLGYTDIDDVILNTFGGFVGATIIKRRELSKRWVVALTFVLSVVILILLGMGSSADVLAEARKNVAQ